MPERVLNLFLDGTFAGRLTQTAAGRNGFVYDEEYRGGASSYPVSLSMPLARREHAPKAVNAFLWGLLPDRPEVLQRMGREYGVSANNPMALLAQVGHDAAGAVQILSEGEESRDAGDRTTSAERLDDRDVADLLSSLSVNSSTWDPSRNLGRWSLAGAQSKVALFRFPDGGWGVPTGATPTTHILKPSLVDYPGHSVNEHITAAAARRLGLIVADSEVLDLGGVGPVFVSRRYDRIERDGQWHRLHQEDMCQALAVLPLFKYQKEGGPGVAAIAGILDAHAGGAGGQSARRFFDALVFNVTMAGTDSHAKNFSVLIGSGRVVLAPLYDMATAAPYSYSRPLESPLRIGGEYLFARIGKPELLRAARSLGVSEQIALERIESIRSGISEAYDASARTLAAARPSLATEAFRVANAVRAHVAERGYGALI